MKLTDLNKRIEDIKKVNAEQERSLKKEKHDYLLSQTVTIGELLNKSEVDSHSTQHWSSPSYYIRRYVEEIILKREN